MLYKIILFEDSKYVDWNEFEILIKNSWRKIQKNLNTYTSDYEYNKKIWGYENTIDTLRKGSRLILVFHDNILIGTATINKEEHKNEKTICITKLAVKKEYRKKGIGKDIINFCENLGKEEGCHWLTLFTSGLLENLVSYYEKLGFQRYKLEKVLQFGIEYDRIFFDKNIFDS